MRRSKKRRVLFVLFSLWIFLIFSLSLQPAVLSSAVSRWVLSRLQRLPFVSLSLPALRAAAHIAEFFALGVFCFLFFFLSGKPPKSAAVLSFAFGGAAALCDETLQLFAAGRTWELSDLGKDLLGFSLGLFCAAAVCLLKKKCRWVSFSK